MKNERSIQGSNEREKRKGHYRNAGRKPMEEREKKQVVRLWLTGFELESLGGLEAVKEELMDYLKKKIKKSLDN